MSPTVLYRFAAVMLVLFAAGHTVGFLTFVPASAEGLAVHDSMNNVRFDYGGKQYTYGGFYKGFGLTITAPSLLGDRCLELVLTRAHLTASGRRHRLVALCPATGELFPELAILLPSARDFVGACCDRDRLGDLDRALKRFA